MKRSRKGKRAAFVAAQTGGHLLPALETARVMIEMGWEVTLVSSGQAIEKEILKNCGIPLRTLQVERIKAMGFQGMVKGLLSIPGALVASGTMLREIRPDVVAGFGGFTSGPFVLAASLMRIPAAIFEANSVPGITNRILARRAKIVFVTFPAAGERLGRKDFEVTGNPVRREILDVNRAERTEPGSRLLILGGSQGSRFLNNNMPAVAAALSRNLSGLSIRHQTGLGNSQQVADAYSALGIQAQTGDYIHDMAAAYEWADFVVCRSGAGTVGEITAVGLPAMFVPFALAADDHQAHNAMDLTATGAALMVREQDFDTETVAERIAGVMSSPETMKAMSAAAEAAGRRDAAERIARGIAGMA